MSWGNKERDLIVGRKALSGGLVAPQALSRTFLRCCAGEPFEQVLAAEAGLSPPQVLQLSQSVEVPPPIDPRPEQVRKVLMGVRCDLLLERGEDWARYVGVRQRDPQPVTLLHIRHDALRNGLWLDFLESVRAAKDVESANLLPTLYVGRDDDGFGIISRFYPGSIDLRRLLDRVVRLKLSEVLRISREVAQGLESLHAKGVVHRALTPENVVMSRDGTVRLRDVGVVREAPGASMRGMSFGSLHYMGPECFKGDPANPMSDIYAVGVMCFEAATGTRPFEGSDFGQLRTQHEQIPPLKPHEILQDLPGTFSDLTTWLLSKQPNERPDAAKLVNVLKTLERGIDRTGQTQKFQAFRAKPSS